MDSRYRIDEHDDLLARRQAFGAASQENEMTNLRTVSLSLVALALALLVPARTAGANGRAQSNTWSAQVAALLEKSAYNYSRVDHGTWQIAFNSAAIGPFPIRISIVGDRVRVYGEVIDTTPLPQRSKVFQSILELSGKIDAVRFSLTDGVLIASAEAPARLLDVPELTYMLNQVYGAVDRAYSESSGSMSSVGQGAGTPKLAGESASSDKTIERPETALNGSHSHAIDTAESDPGVDLARVISRSASFRASPGNSARVIATLENGTRLVLVDRTPVGDWYNAIEIASGKEGWIHRSVIRIAYTKKKNDEPVFHAERVPGNGPPSVIVQNDSKENLTLKVGSMTYQVPSQTSRTFTMTAGTYRYYASAPGVLPALGEQTFERSYEYEWRFWIETTFR